MNRTTTMFLKLKMLEFYLSEKDILNPLPPFSCNFVVVICWGMLVFAHHGGLAFRLLFEGGGVFHFYTDAKALILVGAEVYSTTNDREKSISLCRHVYSLSQNV